jgi:hypothetical protein
MTEIEFPTRNNADKKKPYTSFRFDQEWMDSLAEETVKLSKEHGRKVSMAAMIATSVNKQFPNVKERYEELKNERGTKHWDVKHK